MADFYTVRQGQPQQGRPAAGGRGNMPPPPPPPPGVRQQVNPQGGGGGGGGVPPPPPQHPMMPGPQGHHGHQGHQGPPPPAMHQVPPQVRQRPLVEISDIRRERRTEADYRDDLTEYFVYRFEKVLTEDGYDSDGDKVKATWENCLRTRVTDISKKVAFREIQSLNKNTKSLADKKKGLVPAQQRQLEKALQELSMNDNDDRFEYTLVQIDHQLKPFVEKKSKKESSGKKTKIKDSKKKYQRVSITAYYKRAPLPTINAQQLMREMQMVAQQQAQAAQQRAMFMQQQMAAQQHAQQQQQQHAQQHHQQQQQGPRVIPVHHPNERQGHRHDRRDPRHHGDGSASSDRSSDWSDDESRSEGSTAFTEPSRSSGDSYERRRRSRRYIEEGPKHFGIHNGPTRRHSIHDNDARGPIYVIGGSPRAPEPPQPPRIMPPALPHESLERMKLNAFEEGRAAQREEDWREIEAAARYEPRVAPRPAILQARPTVVRHVTTSEVDRQLDDFDGRFATLNLNDPRRSVEVLYPHEIDEIRREDLRRRRAADARFRMEEEDSLFLEREQARRAQDYMRSRELSPSNPFAPRRRYYDD